MSSRIEQSEYFAISNEFLLTSSTVCLRMLEDKYKYQRWSCTEVFIVAQGDHNAVENNGHSGIHYRDNLGYHCECCEPMVNIEKGEAWKSFQDRLSATPVPEKWADNMFLPQPKRKDQLER